VTSTSLRTAALAAALMLPLAAAADGADAPPQGKQLYMSYCARCHGMNMVTTGASFDLRSFPKDQRERFDRSVTQGLRAMPAWGTTLEPDELQALWLYVSSGGGS
jgi:cytochrome c55X